MTSYFSSYSILGSSISEKFSTVIFVALEFWVFLFPFIVLLALLLAVTGGLIGVIGPLTGAFTDVLILLRGSFVSFRVFDVFGLGFYYCSGGFWGALVAPTCFVTGTFVGYFFGSWFTTVILLFFVDAVFGFFVSYEFSSLVKIDELDLGFYSTLEPYAFGSTFLLEFKGGFIYVEGLVVKVFLVSDLGWIGFFRSIAFYYLVPLISGALSLTTTLDAAMLWMGVLFYNLGSFFGFIFNVN